MCLENVNEVMYVSPLVKCQAHNRLAVAILFYYFYDM